MATEEEHVARHAVLQFKKEKEQKELMQQKIKSFMHKVVVTLRHPEAMEHVDDANIQEAFKYLSIEEKQRLIHIAEVHDEKDINRIILCPSKGNKTGNPLGGFLISLDNKAVIRDVSVVVNPHAPFMLTSAVALNVDQELLSRSTKELRTMFKQSMLDAVRDLPTDGPSVSDIYSSESEADSAPWPTFFPRRNASIGLYRDKGTLMLIASSHAGERAGEDLQKIVSERGDMTVDSFINSTQVAWIKRMARRNLMRLLFLVANALKLKVNHEIDQHAHIPRFHRPTRMCVPMFLNCNGNYRQGAYNHAIFYQDCIDNGASIDGLALIRGAPHDGYAMVKQSPSHMTMTSMMLPMSTSIIPSSQLKCLSEHELELASSISVSRSTGEGHVVTHRTHDHISPSSFHKVSLTPLGLRHSDDWSENRALPITVVFH